MIRKKISQKAFLPMKTQEELDLKNTTQIHYSKNDNENSVFKKNTYQLDYKIINFCREYFLNGGDKFEAYIKAFNYTKKENTTEKQYRKQISTNICKLLKNKIVQSKIDEIKKGLGEFFNYKAENQFLELNEIKEKASLNNQLNIELQATIKKGELCGCYIEKKEISGNSTKPLEMVLKIKGLKE